MIRVWRTFSDSWTLVKQNSINSIKVIRLKQQQSSTLINQQIFLVILRKRRIKMIFTGFYLHKIILTTMKPRLIMIY